LVLFYGERIIMATDEITVPTYLSSGFVGREKLGILLNQQKLTNIGVEVGTHRGMYVEKFMPYWEGKKLFCVDPWYNPEGYEAQSRCLRGLGVDRDLDYSLTEKVAAKFAPRIKLLKMLSEEAAPKFEDNSLDFVYVDGDHSLPGITLDLKLWYPKVKSGGLLAGHDIVTTRKGVLDPKVRAPIDNDFGRNIRKALFELIKSLKIHIDIYLIPETGENWSFYIVKP